VHIQLHRERAQALNNQNTLALSPSNLHNQQDHPLQIIKTWITQYFDDVYVDKNSGSPVFEYFDTLSPVVTTTMCFDDLLTPADHPSRSRSDTYYLDEHRLLRSHMTAHQVTVHVCVCLRARIHVCLVCVKRITSRYMTAAQTSLLRQGRRAFLYTGDVYRRDAVSVCVCASARLYVVHIQGAQLASFADSEATLLAPSSLAACNCCLRTRWHQTSRD
jgi:hypothetical protein